MPQTPNKVSAGFTMSRHPLHATHSSVTATVLSTRQPFADWNIKLRFSSNHEGDLFRTRLTHSLEVAQLARGIARTLKLHEDLTEAIALAHDLGHTPFGHAGQDALNACMRDYGGLSITCNLYVS